MSRISQEDMAAIGTLMRSELSGCEKRFAGLVRDEVAKQLGEQLTAVVSRLEKLENA